MAVGLMLWLIVAPSLPLSAQGADVVERARRLIESGDVEAAIALLEGHLAKIRGAAGQEKAVAEAGYLLARACYMAGAGREIGLLSEDRL